MTKILIVDDESDMDVLIRHRFRKEAEGGQFEFYYARHGQEALDILSQNGDIELILSDINMPEMDGLTLLQKISDSKIAARTVIISAYGDMDNIRTAMNRGAFDFVMKPINFDDLRTTIDKTLKTIAKEKEAQRAIAENRRLSEEFRIARDVQRKLLPEKNPISSEYDVFAMNIPAMEIGGDYYDYIPFDDGAVGFIIADVAGKGASAAFYMAELKGIVHSAARNNGQPKDVLSHANHVIYRTVGKTMFMTASLGILNQRVLTFARAGHCPLILSTKEGTRTIESKGIGLGLDRGPIFDNSIEQVEIPLSSNDVVVFITDGVCEAANAADEEFGLMRVADTVAKHRDCSAEDITKAIVDEVMRFCPTISMRDDMTLITIKIR